MQDHEKKVVAGEEARRLGKEFLKDLEALAQASPEMATNVRPAMNVIQACKVWHLGSECRFHCRY